MIRYTLALLALAFPVQAEVDIQVVESPGGITAWLVEEPEIPFTALEIRFGGGTSLDAPGKRGAVNLMMGLLEEGAGELSARDFATASEELAARFDYDAYADSVSISARFLTENRDEAVELLRLALNEPRFDQEALDRVRAQVEANIRSDLKDPDTIAVRAFNRAAFPDHPYGSASEGSLDSVAALTREDIIAAHQGALALDRLYVSAVGDIDAETLATLLDDLLGNLPATGAPMPENAGYALSGGLTVVDFDTPQSVALFGHQGITRDDPDFFAAFVLNEALGGSGFDSRLQQEVRVKRGLTYGVYTYLAPRDHAELYMGQV
ncbi:MAG: pitrilysin family protein, partial [Pseudomonadota bacterium]